MKLALPLALASAVAFSADFTPADVQRHARGFAIETALVTGAAVAKAKDHVDVIATVTDAETHKQTTVMLLQNVVVLSNAAPAPGEARQLVLLVLPEEAMLLAHAREAGRLTVALRNPDDVDLLLEPRPTYTLKSVITGEFRPTKK